MNKSQSFQIDPRGIPYEKGFRQQTDRNIFFFFYFFLHIFHVVLVLKRTIDFSGFLSHKQLAFYYFFMRSSYVRTSKFCEWHLSIALEAATVLRRDRERYCSDRCVHARFTHAIDAKGFVERYLTQIISLGKFVSLTKWKT